MLMYGLASRVNKELCVLDWCAQSSFWLFFVWGPGNAAKADDEGERQSGNGCCGRSKGVVAINVRSRNVFLQRDQNVV